METLRNPTPTSVYCYYDDIGLLIYVGITSTGIVRNRQHNDDKEWWPFVVEQKVEHFPTRAEALGREKHLIQKHRPPFNQQHNRDYIQLRAAYLLARQSGVLTAVSLKGIAPIEHRRFTVGLHETFWDTGEVLVRVGADVSPAVMSLVREGKIPVFRGDERGRHEKIGEVEDFFTVGALAQFKLRIKDGWRFDAIEFWLRVAENKAPIKYGFKQVCALRCVKEDAA